jgi:anaerobic ribonucleoside-triphosphate reductase
MEPIVQEVVLPIVKTVVLGILSVILAGIGVYAKKQAGVFAKWLDTRATANKQNILWSVAQEAYSIAEAAIYSPDAQMKKTVAYDYAAKKLAEQGINVTGAEIEAKIQEAWIKLEGIPEGKKAKLPEVKINE